MRLRLGLFLTLALILGSVTLAAAEPAFKGTLSAETPKFTWESSGSGAPENTGEFRCTGDPFNCEYILLDVKAAGQLQLTLDSTEGVDGPSDPTGELGEAPLASAQDIDGYLYKSNAAGEPQGDTLTNGDDPAADCVTSHASETCKVPVEAGFYVLEVEFYAAFEAPYTGTAELIGATPAAAPPAEPTAPAPPAAPQQPAAPPPSPQPASQPAPKPASKKKAKKKSRRACIKKAKKKKNAKKRKKAIKRCNKKRR